MRISSAINRYSIYFNSVGCDIKPIIFLPAFASFENRSIIIPISDDDVVEYGTTMTS